MVDKTIQEQRKENLINLLIQLGRINIDRDKLISLIYNEAFNTEFGEKQKTWTFFDSFNQGHTLNESFESWQFEKMITSANRLIAIANLDDPKKYQTREISENEILEYYGNNPDATNIAKARLNNFVDKYLKIFNDNELNIRDIEEYCSEHYFNGMYQNAENNPEYVANVFGDLKTQAIKKRYVERALDNLPGSQIANEIKCAYDNIDKKDFRKILFSQPVNGHLGENTLSSLIRMIKCLTQGYDDYLEHDFNIIMHNVLISKFMSIHDEEYRRNLEDVYTSNLDKWENRLKSMVLEEDFEHLLDFMMECYEKKKFEACIDREFIDYFKSKRLDELKSVHLFNVMYDIFDLNKNNADKYSLLLLSLEDSLQTFNLHRDIEKKIKGFEKPDTIKYLYSKSSSIIEENLENEYWRKMIEAEEPEFSSSYWSGNMLDSKIMDMYAEDPDRIDNEVLEYFRSRIADHTGHNMARGVLSPDFMQEYGYDLIKIVVNSDYDKKTAMRIIDDIITKDRIDEPNM